MGLAAPLSAADPSATSVSIAAPSEPAAIAALRLKAERGNPIAQYNLGLAFAQGREIPADFPEAFVWLTIAVQRGSRPQALNALVKEMTQEQSAEGIRRLAAVRADHPDFFADVANPVATFSAATLVRSSPQQVELVAPPVQVPIDPPSTAEVDVQRQLSGELAAAWKESERLQADLAIARTAASTVSDLQVQLKEIRLAQAALSAELVNAQAERDQLRLARDAAVRERNDLVVQEETISAAATARSATAQSDSASSLAALADANRRISDLTAALARLEVEKADLLAKAKAPPPPDPEVARLRSTLEESNVRLQRVQLDLVEARDRATALDSTQQLLAASALQLRDATQRVAALEQESASRVKLASNAASQLHELELRLSQREAELQAMTAARNEAAERASNVAAKADSAAKLSDTHADLDEKFAAVIQERTALANRVGAVEKERDAVKGEVASRMTTLAQELAAAQRQATTAEKIGTENTELAAKVSAADIQIARQTQKLLELETDKETLAARVVALEGEWQATKAASSAHLATLTRELESARQEAAAAQKIAATNTELSSKASTASTQAAEQTEIAHELAMDKAVLTARVGALDRELLTTKAETSSHVAALTRELESARQEVAAAQKIAATNAELSAKASTASTQASEQTQLLHQLTAEKATLAARTTALEQELRAARAENTARLAALNQDVDAFRHETAAAKELLDQSIKEKRQTHSDRAAIQQKNRELLAAQDEQLHEIQQPTAAVEAGKLVSAANNSSAQQIVTLQSELAAMQLARDDARSKLGVITVSAKDAAASAMALAKLQEAHTTLASRVNAAEAGAAEATRLREQLAAVTASQTSLATEQKRAETRMAELSADNVRLQATIVKADAARVPDARKDLEASRRAVAEMQGKLETMTAELAGARSNASAANELTLRITRLESENATLTAKIASSAPAASISPVEVAALRSRADAAESNGATPPAEVGRPRQLLAGESTVRRPIAAPTRPAAATATPPHAALAIGTVAKPPAVQTPGTRTHTIVFGDTLSGISFRYYGTANRWREIFAANRANLRDERTLVAGRILEIP